MSNTENNVSAANPLAKLETMVAKGDEVLSLIVGGLIDKNNDVKAGPATTLLKLQEIYGEDLETAGFPRPVKDADAEAGVNGPHEFFEAPKPDGKGALKMSKCNFFTEFWADTARGKAQNFVLSQIALLKDEPARAEQKYRDMSHDAVNNLKKKMTNDKSKGRSLIRDAVACYYVLEDALPYEDRVTLDYMTDDQGVLSQTLYPFNLIDNKRLRKSRPLSVSDVKKLDFRIAVADAGEQGSLYDRLEDQLTRGGTTPEGEAATFAKFNDALKAVAQFNNYLDNGSEDGRAHQQMITELFAKKGSDEIILAWGEFVGNVNALWTKPLQNRFRQLIDKLIETRALDEVKEADAA